VTEYTVKALGPATWDKNHCVMTKTVAPAE